MTRSNRKKDRSFEDTFDLIMICTIGLICLMGALSMFTAFYLLIALINTV